MLNTLTSTISPRALGLARIVIGTAALIRSYVTWRVLHRLTDPEVMHAPYLDWMPEPSTPIVAGIMLAWVVSAILFTLGWRVPLTGSVLLVSIVATLALDQQTYGNHLYLMAWLVLLLTVADAGAGINIHRDDRPVVRWPVLLIMLQLTFVYGFAALTKLNESFFSGAVLAGTLGHGLLAFPDVLRNPQFLSPLAAMAVLAELYLAVFIWHPRFRPAAFVIGLALHTAITLLMSGTLQLLVFSLEMLALYPLFLSREKLVVIWDDACTNCRKWVQWFQRIDVLHSLEPIGKSDPDNPVPANEVEQSMHLVHHRDMSTGFRAVVLTLEHLVPTLWAAPVLRLPLVRSLGEHWYRWHARKRSCPVGVRVGSGATGGSKAR